MQDRVSLYPGRVKLEPVAGQANTYDLTRADQPTQEGTPLNKANLLSDLTAAKFGNAETVNAVLAILSKAAVLTDGELKLPDGSIVPAIKLAFGTYTGSGTFGSDNQNSLTFEFIPRFVAILPVSEEGRLGIYNGGEIITTFPTGAKSDKTGGNYYNYSCPASLSGKTLKWWGRSIGNVVNGPDAQLNKSGVVYRYFAIGAT